MPGKYISLRVHFIWSTLERRPWISSEIEEELYRSIGGIFRNKNGALIEAGGDRDHTHLYASLPSTISLAEIVNAVKSNSSGWIHERFPEMRYFAWQKGYGAFSVSQSMERELIQYLRNQKTHHRKLSFKEEFVSFLERHQIEYDERYLWD